MIKTQPGAAGWFIPKRELLEPPETQTRFLLRAITRKQQTAIYDVCLVYRPDMEQEPDPITGQYPQKLVELQGKKAYMTLAFGIMDWENFCGNDGKLHKIKHDNAADTDAKRLSPESMECFAGDDGLFYELVRAIERANFLSEEDLKNSQSRPSLSPENSTSTVETATPEKE